MIWIIGQYADRIENADELLDDFLYTFLEEPVEVQMALLTATVKLFIKRPTAGQELVPKVLKWATEETANPDLRDRGYIYWRLLSTDPASAKAIVLSDKPSISTESDNLDIYFLDELLLHISSLASIYHKSPTTFIHHYKPRYLTPSPVLQKQPQQSLYQSAVATINTPTSNSQSSIMQTDNNKISINGTVNNNNNNSSTVNNFNDLGYNSIAANR